VADLTVVGDDLVAGEVGPLGTFSGELEVGLRSASSRALASAAQPSSSPLE
jgi:hypothetical protein